MPDFSDLRVGQKLLLEGDDNTVRVLERTECGLETTPLPKLKDYLQMDKLKNVPNLVESDFDPDPQSDGAWKTLLAIRIPGKGLDAHFVVRIGEHEGAARDKILDDFRKQGISDPDSLTRCFTGHAVGWVRIEPDGEIVVRDTDGNAPLLDPFTIENMLTESLPGRAVRIEEPAG